jgi:hypothetical protein
MLWDGLEAVLWVLPAFQWIPPQGQHTPDLPNMVVFTILIHTYTLRINGRCPICILQYIGVLGKENIHYKYIWLVYYKMY